MRLDGLKGNANAAGDFDDATSILREIETINECFFFVCKKHGKTIIEDFGVPVEFLFFDVDVREGIGMKCEVFFLFGCCAEHGPRDLVGKAIVIEHGPIADIGGDDCMCRNIEGIGEDAFFIVSSDQVLSVLNFRDNLMVF